MDNSFEVGGRKFKLNKLTAFKQFHLVRRLAPLFAELLPALGEVQKVSQLKDKSESEKFEEMAKIFSPILMGLSKLSDADSDKVLFGLLSSVEMENHGTWSKVATESVIMFHDLELPMLLQLAGRAFAFNLTGFFAVLPQVS